MDGWTLVVFLYSEKGKNDDPDLLQSTQKEFYENCLLKEAERVPGWKVGDKGQTGSGMEDSSPDEMSTAPTEALSMVSGRSYTHAKMHTLGLFSGDGDLNNLKG